MATHSGAAAVSAVRVLSPAKLNLGLSIIGKRPDGYHQIDTIMSMIDLCDVITLQRTEATGITISGLPDVPVESNLITRAIRGWCARTGQQPSFHVDIEKRIPSPAGLGGGSSNAAAAIKALDALAPNTLPIEEMHELASSLGADCPFFLGTATARATGTGTAIKPIELPTLHAVVVVPPTNIAAKTATLYGALTPEDYGTMEQIDRLLEAMAAGNPLWPTNSFTRAALSAFPETRNARDVMEHVTGSCFLSGAGPAIYSLAADLNTTNTWAVELRSKLPADHFVISTSLLNESPILEMLP